MALYLKNDENKIVNDAIQIATHWHSNQIRKGKQIPYILHPLDVANKIAYYSGLDGDELYEAMAIAILHDILEDTGANKEDLAKIFSESIVGGVVAISKEDREDTITRLRILKKTGAIPSMVKLADRASNLETFPAFWSREKISRYLDDSLLISEVLGHFSEGLNALLVKKIYNTRKVLSLFGEI